MAVRPVNSIKTFADFLGEMNLVLVVICALVSCVTALEEGSPCIVQHIGSAGECRILRNCPQAISDLKKFRRLPTMCGTANGQRYVCCPASEVLERADESTNAPSRISAQSK